MEKIKKYGKVLLGVALLGGAVFTQSFTNHVNDHNKLAGEVYGNTSANGDYEKLSSPYDPNNCQSTSQENCAWRRTNTPGTVPDSFDAATAESLHAAGLIEPIDDKKGVYIP